MRKLGLVVLAMVVAAGMPPAAKAAEAQFRQNGETYTVRTNTTGGSCSTETILQGGKVGSEVKCTDGSISAVGNTLIGCVSIALDGLCAKGEPAPGPSASTQVNCTGGVSYNISTGDNQGSCNTSSGENGNSGSCSSSGTGGTTNAAAASCQNGCGSTSGAGCCCQAGTSGCGPGQNCHS